MADTDFLTPVPLLSELAVRYRNRKFIAGQIFPAPALGTTKFEYPEFDSGVTFQRANTRYGKDVSANVLDLKGSKKTDKLEPHALAAYVDEEDGVQSGGLAAAKANTTTMLVDGLLLDLEKEVADTLRDTNVITQNTTLVGANQWSHVDSDPQKAVLEKASTLILRPNTLVLGRQVVDGLLVHPKVRDACKFTPGAMGATELEAQLARYFGVERLLVGEAFVDTAAQGQAQSLGFVWGKDAILLHSDASVEPDPMMGRISAGYLGRKDYGGGKGQIWRVYESTVGTRGTGEGSTYLKVESWWKLILGAKKLCFLFKAAVA